MSLVELLVAMAILSVAMVVALTIYQGARESYKRGENVTEQQQIARIAFDLISSEVRLAGLNLYPDGDKTRPDEAIEAAFGRAIVIRADFDGDDPTDATNPEVGLSGGAYATVSTGNDEIHGFVLAKSNPDGTATGPDSFTFDADVGQSRRDGGVEPVNVDNVALVLDDPPYTLYRISLDNDPGQYGSSGFANRTVLADNIRDLRFRYFDAAGNEIAPPGGNDDTARINARASISRVAVELETLTRNPDPRTKTFGTFQLAGEVTPRNRGKIRIPDVGSTPFPPGQPGRPEVVEGHCEGLIIRWPENPRHDQVAYYRIRYGTDPFDLDDVVATTETDHYLNGLDDATDYTVKIEAINGAAMASRPSAPTTRRTQNLNTPAPPANLIWSAPAAGGVELTWDAVTQNTVPVPDSLLRDLDGYRVYRDTVSGLTPDPAKLIADEGTVPTQSSPRYTDRKAVSCRTYYYLTTAVDDCGVESVSSGEASGTLTTVIQPRTPEAVQAFFDGAAARLEWQTVRDDVDGDAIWIEDYKIYRTDPILEGTAPLVPNDFTLLTTVSGVNEYVDTPAPVVSLHWYMIQAIDDCGNESAYSQLAAPVCSFNGDVVIDEPDHREQEWPKESVKVFISQASGAYEELRLSFVNEDDGTTYLETLPGPGDSWSFSMGGPGEGPFTEGWYTITAEVDQYDGAVLCTKSATRRFLLSND